MNPTTTTLTTPATTGPAPAPAPTPSPSPAPAPAPAPAPTINTVVFDLDGTLVDTVADIAHAVNRALQPAGLPALTLAEVRGQVGLGGTALVRRALAKAGREAGHEEVAELQDAYLTAYAAEPVRHSTVYPGAARLLDELRGCGVRLGICTNKSGRITGELLAALDLTERVDAVVTGDTLPVRKPDPRPLRHTVELAGGTAALMVGDSTSDVRAARAARLPVACVAFGYHDDVAALAPDAVLTDYATFFTTVRGAGIPLPAPTP
ncbi:phosphoglycolate phosphatase [Streptomyces natalensis]|uniref:phosphoglycolate phosphatase n=1 Tax=Streptomyces natalensis TaxID=68242 RepID=UPI000A4AD482|nr:phosphoglycolate phosphatase [Streptomyces natalensis]